MNLIQRSASMFSPDMKIGSLRHRRLNAAAIVLLVNLCLPAGCNREPAASDERILQVLSDSTAAADSSRPDLIRLQREMFAAVLNQETRTMSRLLDSRFVAHDTRTSAARPLTVDRQVGVERLDYIEVMAGRLAERLDSVYSRIEVRIGEDEATVYAIGSGDAGTRTTWTLRDGVWKASGMIIVNPQSLTVELRQDSL